MKNYDTASFNYEVPKDITEPFTVPPQHEPARNKPRKTQKLFPLQAEEYKQLVSTITADSPYPELEELPPPQRPELQHKLAATDALAKDALGKYLDSISTVPLLNAEEEVTLAKRIECGVTAQEVLKHRTDDLDDQYARELEWIADDGTIAKEHLLEANTRLVVSIARKSSARNVMPIEDIVQNGNNGLVRAVEKFDYTKGFKFSTYATWWIKQSISRGAAMDADLIRIPVHVHDELRAIDKAKKQLEELDIEPTPARLAAETTFSIDRVNDLLTWSKAPVSLDSPREHGGDKRFSSGNSLMDFIDDRSANADDYETFEHGLMLSDMNEKLVKLFCEDPRTADIVASRFGIGSSPPVTLENLGERWGITTERVRQIEKAGVAKLRMLMDIQVTDQTSRNRKNNKK